MKRSWLPFKYFFSINTDIIVSIIQIVATIISLVIVVVSILFLVIG